jgi:hypothetical protein
MVGKRTKTVKARKSVKRPNVNLANSQPSTTSETDEEQMIPLQKKTVGENQQNSKSGVNTKNVRVKQKPITINNTTVETIKVLLSQIQCKSIIHHKILSDGNIQIISWNYEDKLKIIEMLKSKNLKYFTYSELTERQLIFVLKRHYFVSTDDMLALLKSNGIPATKVSFLNKNEKNPSYLVHFERDSINYFVLSNTFHNIDGLIIKWEKLNKHKKKITQCHKCQSYGHSAINCGRDYRCVKCLDQHLPGQCQRKTKEGNPKCVNCLLDHAANSKQCKFFVTYKEKIEKSKKKIETKTFTSTPAPWMNNNNLALNKVNFPLLPSRGINSNISGKAPTTPQQHSTLNEFADIQSEFATIPGIEETLANFKIFTNLLKATTDEKQRFAIIIKYCGI